MKQKYIIAGVDEVGRGCLAGPVVSAAVILKKNAKIRNLKDSKKLTFQQRIEVSKEIKKNSTFSIGIASVKEIENLNILQASLLSMKRAIRSRKRPAAAAVTQAVASPMPRALVHCRSFPAPNLWKRWTRKDKSFDSTLVRMPTIWPCLARCTSERT